MKKIVLSFLLILVAQLSFGQTASDFVNAFKNNPACQYMPISKEMVPLVAAQAPADQQAIFKKIEGMDLMVFANTDDTLKNQMKGALAKLDANYTKQEMDEAGGKAIIYFKIENDIVKEMLAYAEQGPMTMCTTIKGSFSLDEILALAKGMK